MMDEISVENFKKIWLPHTNKETAKHFGVSLSTIDRITKKHNLFKWKVDLPNNFTKKQKELLIGSLLGDGSLSKPKRGKSNFSECHSVKQKEYLVWKNDLLKPFSRKLVSTPPIEAVFPNGKIGKRKESWQCYTLYHQLFAEMEKQWYLRNENGYVLKNNRRIKCLPEEISVSSFSFAVWFFDDGYNNWSQRNAAISTDGFSEDECNRLVAIIDDSLSMYTRVRRTSGDNYEIYIPARTYFDCMDMIKDQKIRCECMSYKFDTSKCIKKQFSQEKIDAIFDLRESGLIYKEIAAKLETSTQYVCKIYNHQKHRAARKV